MAITSRLFRIPRPDRFLFLMSLRTGTELIVLTILLNKISGLYGLLAIFTGVSLSPLQLSMYIYSVVAFVLTAYLARHIRKQSPLQCLALAWFYILDSIVNALYTAAFAGAWFLVISQHHTDSAIGGGPGRAGDMIGDTAGFTNSTNSSRAVTSTGQAAASGTAAARSAGNPSMGHGVFMPESITSLVVIGALWTARIYFVLVVMAYARSVLRQHMFNISTAKFYDGKDAVAESPFAAGSPAGEGWKGSLGRVMVGVGKAYWLGFKDDEWARGMGGKFRRSTQVGPLEPPGTIERERRRRSGTGPPAPPPTL